MARQPAQRSLFEGFRRQSEVTRTTQIAANDRIGQRNVEARFAAAQAQQDADAATTAANAASAEAANATAAVGEATSQIDAANTAAAAATAAVATANLAMAHLARSTIATVTTTGNIGPDPEGAFSNKLGLVLSGPAEGLLSVVRVAIPIAGYSGSADAFTRRQLFELRLNGVAVCQRQASSQAQRMMNFTYAHTTPLPAGISTYELWYAGGDDGFIDAGAGNTTVRSMTVTLLAA